MVSGEHVRENWNDFYLTNWLVASQGTWLGLVSQSVNEGPCDLQVKLVTIIQQIISNKVSFLVGQVWPCHIQIVD